jgi:hypothetical protein
MIFGSVLEDFVAGTLSPSGENPIENKKAKDALKIRKSEIDVFIETSEIYSYIKIYL